MQTKNPLATCAIAFGIVSVALCGLVFGPIGICLGIVSLCVEPSTSYGRTNAILGIVLGSGGLLLHVAGIVLILTFPRQFGF